ncbi:I78 family peptidase inhibitor [Pseudomonas entomophila]|uniref:I78 family peptidase inhibitor n=1 Tax=Pseudomonas entomophila TaxID=312306 RepID=UPI003EB8DC32
MEHQTDKTMLVNHLIGTRYVESVKPYILEMTGLKRVVGPNEPSTLDFRTDRIHVHTDEAGNISQLHIA